MTDATARLAPPFTPAGRVAESLAERGHAVLDPLGCAAFVGHDLRSFEAMRDSWNDLPADGYLRDGGRYRRRRHASFIVDGAAVELVAHRAHWQPVEYNALHGGLERWFAPIEKEVIGLAVWHDMLTAMAALATSLRGARTWFAEAHQFRIDTTDGIGRPTPEGAHRDGVDLVAVLLVGREGVKGGETRVFDIAGPAGLRFTMQEPWTCLLLDDARVIHESTPIQPIQAYGHRDTLVLTLRARAFQGPGV